MVIASKMQLSFGRKIIPWRLASGKWMEGKEGWTGGVSLVAGAEGERDGCLLLVFCFFTLFDDEL